MSSCQLDRSKMLRELGYGHPDAETAAVGVLVEAKLTTPKKTGIVAEKRKRCRKALRRELILLCSRCARAGAGVPGRRAVVAALSKDCERCGGSANKLAIDRAAEACRRRSVVRVVVVGGSPGVHKSLVGLWPDDLELRIVPGTDRHTGPRARANLGWADVVLVWATTQLDHKVSLLYTKSKPPHAGKVVRVSRRGIEALADRISERLA